MPTPRKNVWLCDNVELCTPTRIDEEEKDFKKQKQKTLDQDENQVSS